MTRFMQKPCAQCPFRKDVRPFLHPARAEELAIAAGNRYQDFPCHKTLERSEDGEELLQTRKSLTCAGFLSLRAAEGVDVPDGFEPSAEQCYESGEEMIEAHANEWRR